MQHAWCLTTVLILYANIYSAKCDPSSGGVRCYDCNYDPGQYSGEAENSPDQGFPRCALRQSEDGKFVDNWKCTSGTCFLRKDPNGMVYRGCADRWNLPWGVNPSVSCTHQGQTAPSLWWFCEGDLCNHGNFGDTSVCPESGSHPEAEEENRVDDISAGDGYPANEDFHGYDDIMVHAETFDEGTYMNDVKAPYYDFQPMVQPDVENLVHEDGNVFERDLPEVQEYPQTYSSFQSLPISRDETLSYGAPKEPPMPLYNVNMPGEIPIPYNGNFPVDARIPDTRPQPVPQPQEEYLGPPPLMTEEFQEHYHSLIPRGGREHTAGFGPSSASEDTDHKSLKSWQPEKSLESPESYHKSWEGNDFSVSYAGEGFESEKGKSSAPSGKSDERHSKSGYNEKSHLPGKSVESMPSEPTNESPYKSHDAPSYEGHSKSDYNPKYSSPKTMSKQYGPMPSKSHEYSAKSTSDYKSHVPQKSEYGHKKSQMPSPKSPYIEQQMKSMPSKTDYNSKNTYQPKSGSQPSKSHYKSPKSHYEPPQSKYYAPKSQPVPPKSNYGPSKSNIEPSKSISPPKSHYNLGKKSQPIKSGYPLIDKSFSQSKSKYGPPMKSTMPEAPSMKSHPMPVKSGVPPPKSHFPQQKKSQETPLNKKTSPPKSRPIIVDQPPKSHLLVPVPYQDLPPLPLPADRPLPLPFPGPVRPEFPRPAPGSHPEVPRLPPQPDSPESHMMTEYRARDEGRDSTQGTGIGAPGQDITPDLKSTEFGDYWYQHYFRGNRNRREKPVVTPPEANEVPAIDENPCRAGCGNNPSGLFPHPTRVDWFIQCGGGMDDNGASCSCCEANYLRCPDGTIFDLVSRVCGAFTDPSNYRG